MSLSVDWTTKVISVPKTYTTLIQSVPTEIRELNINTFRLDLKSIEDSEEGMPFLDTHRHNTEVNVGGLTLARVVELINGYTMTFEDGQYAVNLVGANSNLGDNVNVNQVSVRSFNSAGLTSSPAIEFASFEGGVWVDTTSSTSGTVYPSGTALAPVNNLADAKVIANYRGLNTIYFIGDLTLNDSTDFTEFVFVGQNSVLSLLTVQSTAIVESCEFRECRVTGTLDGDSLIQDAVTYDITYLNGTVKGCGLYGDILIDGGADAIFIECWTELPSDPPVFDLGGTGQNMTTTRFSGDFTIKNLSGDQLITLGIQEGDVTIDSTISNGEINIRGIGNLTDNSTGIATVSRQAFLSEDLIAEAVWDRSVDLHTIIGSAGEVLYHLGLQTVWDGLAVSSTSNTVTLSSGASSVDGAYDPAEIIVGAGTGQGQTRLILEYDGSTRTAVVDRNWKVQPDSTSHVLVRGASGREHVHEGLAQGGTSNTITFGVLGSGDDGVYVGQTVFIRSGTGDDQSRIVIAYNGTTKVATVEEPWAVIPDSTSAYVVLPQHQHTPNELANAILDEPISTTLHGTVGTVGHALRSARQLAIGRWEFDPVTSRMILYEADGITVHATLQMLDENGNPTLEGIYERSPV